jgi:hypothetical protein
MRARLGRCPLVVAWSAGLLVAAGPGPSALAQSLAPGQASGSFSIDGKPLVLRHAIALSQPNRFDEKKHDLAILMTESPVPERALEGQSDLERVARDLQAFALFKIDDSGKPITEVLAHPALGSERLQMSGFTHAAFKPVTIRKDRIEGSFETSQPQDFLKHQYRIKVAFNALIRQATLPAPLPDARTGKRLPADGGEPGQAYFEWEKALQKRDLAAIRKLKPASVPDLPDDKLRKAIDMMVEMSPKDIKLVEGYQRGELGALYVVGVEDGETQYGTIRMEKTGGVWRATDEKWSDRPPKK